MKMYLDTSVPSFLFSSDDPVVTKRFFEKVIGSKEHQLFFSYLTMEEIQATPNIEKRELIKHALVDLPVLEFSEKATKLADRYLKEGLTPPKYRDDALHLAIASVYNMDILVSWNFDHIVRLKTKHGVTGINTLLGYKVIDIISPQELI